MQKEITLAGKVFKQSESNPRHFSLQGEYEGAFFLSVDEEAKTLDVAMNCGCSHCSPAVRRLENLQRDLCEGKPCLPENTLCPYEEEGECVEGTAPLNIYWDEMAADAKRQFPDWEIDQTA